MIYELVRVCGRGHVGGDKEGKYYLYKVGIIINK
jgi:hypothetical protein